LAEVMCYINNINAQKKHREPDLTLARERMPWLRAFPQGELQDFTLERHR
jgi:hypothetical protein